MFFINYLKVNFAVEKPNGNGWLTLVGRVFAQIAAGLKIRDELIPGSLLFSTLRHIVATRDTIGPVKVARPDANICWLLAQPGFN